MYFTRPPLSKKASVLSAATPALVAKTSAFIITLNPPTARRIVRTVAFPRVNLLNPRTAPLTRAASRSQLREHTGFRLTTAAP